MEKACFVCKKTIIKETKTSRKQWAKKKYCSVRCKSIDIGRKFKGNKSAVWVDINREKKCDSCKEEFIVRTPSRIEKTRFCSKKCFYDSRKGNYKPWNKGKFEYHSCKGCINQVRKWQIYCSTKCFYMNRLSPVLIDKVCQFCKKDFQVRLSQKDHIYCSTRCSGIIHGLKIRGKNHPMWKGGKPSCKECGKKLGNYNAERCPKCHLGTRRMTTMEIKLQKIIDKYNLPYKFVGNGKFWIENKNPDFVNTNGEKKAIEVYWTRHKEQFAKGGLLGWKKDRQTIFAKYGWEIIFLDEKSMNKNTILKYLEEVA